MSSSAPQRLLVVYHGAALEPSQRIFAALAAQPALEVRVLGPQRGFNPMRRQVLELEADDRGGYGVATGRVWRAMRDLSGPYLTGLRRELRQFRPDIVHIFHEAYSTLALQALLYRRCFCPTALCYSMGVENIVETANLRPSTRLRRGLVHWLSDGVACWSTGARVALQSAGFPAHKLHVSYWGVPLDLFASTQQPTLRAELGLADRVVVGYVGRILPEKGLQTLLDALALLPTHIHLLGVGDGPWRDGLREHIRALGLAERVHWVSQVADVQVARYMQTMDMLVLPSETTLHWKEQFGRVLPEAMACGVAVVGSSSGAIPEVVGEAGLIVPERNSRAFAAAVQIVADHPAYRRELGQRGIARAHALFSCEAFAERLAALYAQGRNDQAGATT